MEIVVRFKRLIAGSWYDPGYGFFVEWLDNGKCVVLINDTLGDYVIELETDEIISVSAEMRRK